MEKQYKHIDGYLSRGLLCQTIHPLRDAAFGADCLTPFKILKILIFGLRNGFSQCYQEMLHVVQIFRKKKEFG